MEIGVPTASHFIFIPAVLLIGVVIGWILWSRAAVSTTPKPARGSPSRGCPTEPGFTR